MTFNSTQWTRRLEAIPASHFVGAAAAAIVAIGVADHFTGPMTLLTIFYLVPVAAAAWVAGRAQAQWLALLAAVTWAVADQIGPLAEPKAHLAWVNDASILIVFLFINVVISALREQVQRERDVMQEVQRHLLPAIPRIAGVDIGSRWIPAWTVGGDYYDVIDAGADRLAICLADVSGKGIAAALMMSNVQATVRALASSALPPDRLLSALNGFLHQRLRTPSFVTMFFGVLDLSRGELTFANAGHNPPILSRDDGTFVLLDSTGPVAGIFADAAYEAVTIGLGERDRLVIYSDGVTEYHNRAGEEFGEARLRDVLARGAGKTAEETCRAVIDGLHAFGGGRPYDDDVTMLVVCRAPATLPASMETRHATAS
ncbi:MAG TPA: PP2C family protein-serine/threonine phosphatase [Thermoanaerobaculia bacterium]|nr:PP2C family protein-serine/threonine phosphatase [Thermoanaerobaculia bacterium]